MDAYVHPSSIVEDDVVIEKNAKVWHFCHLDSGAFVGESTVLGQNVYLGKGVHIGASCRIQNNVSVYSGVKLEDFVFLGPSCVFTNVKVPRAFALKGADSFDQTIVQKGATIGANATIVCPRTIGCYSFIGAGSLVCQDVKDYELVYGNPARHQAWVCRCGTKLDDNLVCPSCKQRYTEHESGLAPQTVKGI